MKLYCLENVSKKLTQIEAAAQAFIFFIAGYDTSSSAVSLTFYEIALNSEIQDKLHEEIDEVLESGQMLSYEILMDLPYLDMVFSGML
jgi:cytochrome P450